MFERKIFICILLTLLSALVLVACGGEPDTVEATRVVTEIIEVEVTREAKVTREVEIPLVITREVEVIREVQVPDHPAFGDPAWADYEFGSFEGFTASYSQGGKCRTDESDWTLVGTSTHWKAPYEAISLEVISHTDMVTAVRIEYFASRLLPDWQERESEILDFFSQNPYTDGDVISVPFVYDPETFVPDGYIAATICDGFLYVDRGVNPYSLDEGIEVINSRPWTCKEEEKITPLGKRLKYQYSLLDGTSVIIDLNTDRIDTLILRHDEQTGETSYEERPSSPLSNNLKVTIHFHGAKETEEFLICNGQWYDSEAKTDYVNSKGFREAVVLYEMCPAPPDYYYHGRSLQVLFSDESEFIIDRGSLTLDGQDYQMKNGELLVLQLEDLDQLGILRCNDFMYTNVGHFYDGWD